MSARRKNIMLGTAGHVDHGKTALVKLLTGCNTDTLAEEQQRGMTIDLGFAPCRLADERIVGIVDVPGHVDFIRNMVAGAHGIDVVILVIAADDGVMPQTLEHLQILTLMGLRHGVVALTKIDLVDPARLELVTQDVRGLLQGTFLEHALICPLSNLGGQGYEGFFEALNQAAEACEAKTGSGFFRVWVEDVFSIRGFGTVVTGIPTSGTVRLGDPLELVPGAAVGRVRHLQVYGEDAAEGRAGECVAINLAELDHEKVHRGHLLGAAGTIVPAAMAEAELHLLPSAARDLKDYAEVHLHIGTASAQARVAMLEQPRLEPGRSQMVQLRFSQPLGLAPGERFVIRANAIMPDQSGLSTIGGGRVLGLSPVRLRRQRPWILEALQARRQAIDDPDRWCEVLLKQVAHPVTLAEFSQVCRMPVPEIQPLLLRLRAAEKAAVNSEGAWAHADSVRSAADAVRAGLSEFHQANPQRLGIEPAALCAHLGMDRALYDFAVRRLQADGQLEFRGPLVAVSGWQAQVTRTELSLGDRLAARLQKAGYAVPSLDELAIEFKVSPATLQNACRLLVEQGVLVRLEERMVMHRDTVKAAQEVVVRLFSQSSSFTTMDFRDALGVSRKYAVPLLDLLDRLRFTVRTGNSRTPGAEAKARRTAASS
jgi:selenocysteine-specific elongation factor